MAKRPRNSVEREIMDIIPERFDGDDGGNRGKGGGMRLVLSIALGILVIAALGVAGRHLLVGEGQQAQTDASVPVIKPDDKPIKTKPEDRGGMAVPNQDKLVYQDVGKGDNQEAPSASEKLLPPAEKPQMPAMKSAPDSASSAMPPPAASADIPAPPSATGSAPSEPPTGATPAPATPSTNASSPPPPAPATSGKGATSAKQQQMASAAPAPAPAPASPPAKAAPAAAGSGGFQVQLAAMKSEAEAQAAWKKALTANKDLLGSLSEEVVRADLGAKGIYFRLRAGPLDEAAAKGLCAELVKRNQVCIVARKS